MYSNFATYYDTSMSRLYNLSTLMQFIQSNSVINLLVTSYVLCIVSYLHLNSINSFRREPFTEYIIVSAIYVFLQDKAEKTKSFLIISFIRSNGQQKLSLQPCPFSDLLTPFISLTTSLRVQAIKFHKGYHVLLYI